MKLAIALFYIFCFSTNLLACSFPMVGDKYNEKIQIFSLHDEEQFKFIIPAEMAGLDDLEVTLGYSRTDLDGFKLMQE